MEDPTNLPEQPIDLAAALGAKTDEISAERLTLYIPNKDQHNKEFG